MKFNSSCVNCFAGLSYLPRLKIIVFLQKKERASVMEITKHFQLTQPTITHHLQYLKKVGILDSQKEGRRVYYFIKPKCKEGKCSLFK